MEQKKKYVRKPLTEEQKKQRRKSMTENQKKRRTEERQKRQKARVVDLTEQKIQKIEQHTIAKVTGQLAKTTAMQNLEHYDIPQDDIRAVLRNSLYWYGRKLVKTEEQCADRLNEFFSRICQTGEIPTVQRMCLALGADTRLIWKWQASGDARGEQTKRAKQILADIDASLASSGKIPQVVWIFRAKNFYGMRDQQEMVITPNTNETQTVQALQDKYASNELIDITPQRGE